MEIMLLGGDSTGKVVKLEKSQSSVTKGGKVILQTSLGILENLPTATNLYQNYPNPFNPVTVINYDIKDGYNGIVELKVYNHNGQLVENLYSGVVQGGRYSITFNGTKFSSGIYYYAIKTADYYKIRKMIMTK